MQLKDKKYEHSESTKWIFDVENFKNSELHALTKQVEFNLQMYLYK